jgi:hypothetical protein
MFSTHIEKGTNHYRAGDPHALVEHCQLTIQCINAGTQDFLHNVFDIFIMAHHIFLQAQLHPSFLLILHYAPSQTKTYEGSDICGFVYKWYSMSKPRIYA